jgi:hypothetical protein
MRRSAKTTPQLDPNGSAHAVAAQHSGANARVEAKGNGALEERPLDLNVLLHALHSMRIGDFSVRLPRNQIGLAGKIADAFNEIVAANERMADQLEHVGQVVGREGRTRKRVSFNLSHGAWGEMEASVNTLIDDLLWPTTAVTRAITAVARGDLP